MKAQIVFFTEMTLEKKARIFVNHDIQGTECEILNIQGKADKFEKEKMFGLFKFDNLFLSGYARRDEWYPNGETEEYFVFEVDILNFDAVFPRTRTLYFRGEETLKGMYAHMPKEFSAKFDLVKMPAYMTSDYQLSYTERGAVENEIIEMGDFE